MEASQCRGPRSNYRPCPRPGGRPWPACRRNRRRKSRMSSFRSMPFAVPRPAAPSRSRNTCGSTSSVRRKHRVRDRVAVLVSGAVWPVVPVRPPRPLRNRVAVRVGRWLPGLIQGQGSPTTCWVVGSSVNSIASVSRSPGATMRMGWGAGGGDRGRGVGRPSRLQLHGRRMPPSRCPAPFVPSRRRSACRRAKFSRSCWRSACQRCQAWLRCSTATRSNCWRPNSACSWTSRRQRISRRSCWPDSTPRTRIPPCG